jgi:pre-mRNA-splicing factor SYF1
MYEKSITLFPFPHVKELWVSYLGDFFKRYGGSKLERARDLAEQAVASAPPDCAKPLYLLFAELEEKHGLIRHVMAVFGRAVGAVEKKKDMYDMYLRWLAKAEQYLGLTATRTIYEQAVEQLPDSQVKDMCLRFAKMELTLGEVDRARAIYTHASQFCDPRVVRTFWETWKEFEVAHGNEDTFREMLRVKRSVEAVFSQVRPTLPLSLRTWASALGVGRGARSMCSFVFGTLLSPPFSFR